MTMDHRDWLGRFVAAWHARDLDGFGGLLRRRREYGSITQWVEQMGALVTITAAAG